MNSPAKPDSHYDPRERALEKAQSREADAKALASGEKSAEKLREENAPFSRLRFSIDLEQAKRVR